MSDHTTLTDTERATLAAWWKSDWPSDGADVLDTLAEVVAAIVAERVAAAWANAAELADTQIVLWSEVPGLHPEAKVPHPAAIAAAGARRTLVVLRSRMSEAFANAALIEEADRDLDGMYRDAQRTSWTLPLPWTAPPLTGNDRDHWRKKAAKVEDAVNEARWAARAARVSWVRNPALSVPLVATLHWRVPNNRRRDADNIAPTLKCAIDALVRENVLRDDAWTVIPETRQRIHPPSDEGPAMWLTLEELT